jgi:hypothetical protein
MVKYFYFFKINYNFKYIYLQKIKNIYKEEFIV